MLKAGVRPLQGNSNSTLPGVCVCSAKGCHPRCRPIPIPIPMHGAELWQARRGQSCTP